MARRGALALLSSALVGGCAESPRELDARGAQDAVVLAALARDVLVPMGDVLVSAWPSDCRTDGVTDAPVAAGLFHVYLGANRSATAVRRPNNPRLRLDIGNRHPRDVGAELGEPVVAYSHFGILGDVALVCVEVFGVQERAFLVRLRRASNGQWSVTGEFEVWKEQAPEEMPDGELYRRQT